MTIKKNIEKIIKEIGIAKLICVTKTVSSDKINEAIIAGAKEIGESRLQEFEEKCEALMPCKKHMIGHLQRGKVKKAVKFFDCIQSVDSIKLASEIDRHSKSIQKIQSVFIQINIGEEPQKFGFSTEEIKNKILDFCVFKNISVDGIMCIPPIGTNDEIRMYFKKMYILFEELKKVNKENIKINELSMGMSRDYMIAIEEGSTMVRIGSAIFQ
jgi:pyridoxal phosphate enzyme (YggS family)